MQHNPVLLFKQQGVEQTDPLNDLGKNNFLLVLQTEFQKDAMKRYGTKAILMDATHGTTQYDYLNNKQNRRVDRLIRVLQIVRNLVYEQ